MAIIKCKMCGGDLNVEENSQIAVCEYCGTQQTVPKQDNEKKLTLFARANRLRFACEFDKAAGVYESIVAEFPEEAEAYWGLVLCKYGIEYVDDPATGKKVPTCHRSSFDSVLEDANFELVMEYSDVVTRKLYREEAKAIEELRRGIIEVSSREEPYDIFICYKETDENGQRTLDSVLAQDLYDALTEKGYRVFFSRITLEDKLGQEYEPYIFAALNSARVMLAVGTDYEYYNAPWVRNEWSRYLQLIAAGQKKSLIPCYKNIDAYDMPKEFAKLQAQDLGKVGATQDLLRGIDKLIGRTSAPAVPAQPAPMQNAAAPNVDSLLRRGTLFLEDSDWTNANAYFDKVLDIAPECAAAYLGKFLARAHCCSAKAYADVFVKKVKADAPNEKNANACDMDKAFVEDCVKKYAVPGILSAEEIRRTLEFDLGYCKTSDYYALRAEEAQAQLAADKDLMRAEKYASGEAKTMQDSIQDALNSLRADAQKREDAEKARIIAEYRKFLTETEAKLEKEHPQRLKEAEEAKKAEIYRRRKAKAAAKKTGILAGVAAAVIALVLLTVNVILPAVNYSKAEKLLVAGDYDGAIAVYTALGDYKDASEKITQIEEQQENERLAKEAAEEEARNAQVYADAETLLANGDYDSAIAAFRKLVDYQDAASRVEAAEAQKQEAENAQVYANAEALMNAGEYNSAAEAFDMLGDYRDAATRVLECHYIAADQLQAQGKTAEAAFTFAKAAGYKDAQERSSALWDMIPGRETITAGGGHTVALKMDGTAVSVGSYDNGERDIYDWNNIVDISCGSGHTVGLKSDGTVLAAGKDHFDYGQCDVSNWRNIIAVDAGKYYTVGLKADGTVVATGEDDAGQCDVSDWTNIVAISAGDYHTVGLKSDGTVTAVGAGEDGQCNIADWEDIVSISAGEAHTVGLKADGTVVAVGNNEYGQCDVSGWLGIVAISAGGSHTVGLKADGTVIAVGDNIFNQCDVSGWTDIVAISAGGWNTVGLKADGTAVATGGSRADVSTWTDIKLPN